MSDAARPIYERPEELLALRDEMRALGLSTERMFIGTADHPPDSVLRLFEGGIIPGIGSLPDSVAKLDDAMARGAKGIDFDALAKRFGTI